MGHYGCKDLLSILSSVYSVVWAYVSFVALYVRMFVAGANKV